MTWRAFMTGNVCVLGMIVAGLVVAGCAATARNAKQSAERPAAAERTDPTCLTATGNPAASGACRGYGRSFSSDDIRRTGATTVGDALPLLDPSITVHR
jgi:hypothetical protein